MKTFHAIAAAILFAIAFAVPASAGNLFASAAVGVGEESIDSPSAWGDDLSGAFAIGWDFGTPTLAVEYVTDAYAGDDALFLAGGLDFGKGKFRPGIGVGVGITMDGFEFENDHHFQWSAGALYYLTDHVAIDGRYKWISDIDDISDGSGRIMAGVRLDF